MSNIKVQSNVSGSGTLTIAAPSTNTDRTLTLPDESGTVLTSASTLSPSKFGAQFSVNSSAPSGSFAMDSGGRMTLPYQPAFTAQMPGSDAVISNGSVFPFDRVSFNRGSHFNTSNSRFTAPVSGVYFFSWVVFFTSAGGYTAGMNPAIYKNGSVLTDGSDAYQMTATPSALGNQICMGMSTCVPLSAGDYVTINARGADCKVYGGHTKFSGFLIG